MNARRVALSFSLLALASACGRSTPEPEPHAIATTPSATSPAVPTASATPTASASAIAAAPDAAAPVATTTRAGQPVTPRVSMKKLDDTYDGRANEGWPVFEYEGLPALSEDGTKLAVVEERDGWGHTPVPGVRVVDTATGRSLQFLALVPAGKGPEALAALAKLETVFKARIAAANEALAKVKWESLADVTADNAKDRDGWKVDGLAIAVEWATSEPGDLKKVAIRDAASNQILVERDATPWRRTMACATPDLRLIGSNRAKKLVAFSQHLGSTLHNCDGIAIPKEYRIVRLP